MNLFRLCHLYLMECFLEADVRGLKKMNFPKLGSGTSLTQTVAWTGQSQGAPSSGFQTLSLSWASAPPGWDSLY